LYFDTLERCARAAVEDDWLAREIARSTALVSEAAHADTRKLFSNDDFDAGVLFLNEFAALRPGFVAAAVAVAR
jgi:hypothetical protein